MFLFFFLSFFLFSFFPNLTKGEQPRNEKRGQPPFVRARAASLKVQVVHLRARAPLESNVCTRVPENLEAFRETPDG